MANEPPRLTTADLRRRLHAPAAPAPVAEPPRPVAARPEPNRAYLDLPEAPIEVDDYTPAPVAELIPVPSARQSSAELARPSTRSSHYLRRPTLPSNSPDPIATRYAEQSPVYEPAVDQLRFDNEQLRRDNQHLQQLMEEMRQLLQDASEQEQRVQGEISEREEVYATAQARIAELELMVNTKPKTKSELEEWADELERESFQITQERRVMEGDRKQLREDETALEQQMREMEVQMARERAILARQEQELRRLNSEIQHELEAMQRGDGNLRERMAVFQRRHAEVTASPSNGHSQHAYATATIPPSANPTPPPGGKKPDTTGLLRKIFRGGE